MFPLLERIDSPQQLRQLDKKLLLQLASELRGFLIDSVSRTGGHLSSSLGVVELTIALHYVFDTPHDKLVWDVGHQAYPHKILTGRRDAMAGLRRQGGVAGFPRRSESEFDVFGTGHSSTSVSAALGMAVAAQQLQTPQSSIAVIGDGAMTAGMAFEALNNAGSLDANILVVLNDNDMSISPPVGALRNYLAKLLSGQAYHRMRRGTEKVLGVAPSILELAKRAEEHMKGMMLPGTLFEEFGFNYIGPIDGHDLDVLLTTLTNIRKLQGPQFLHVVTQKGYGYQPAEENPGKFHGVGQFDPHSGECYAHARARTYTQVFSDWLVDMAEQDDRLIGITPAMCDGSGLLEFKHRFPGRYFDVGIAEQHALTFAAGMACQGMKPVVAIYSTFLQRAYDQLIHDIAIQNLPVLLAIDRAGVVGADGPTHAGSFDLSFLRCIPNMIVMCPADENECRHMLYTGFLQPGPTAVRYPRGCGVGVTVTENMVELPIGKAELRRQGQRVGILAFGSMLAPALEAGDRCDATVVNMRFVKPLDETLILYLAARHECLVVVEENTVHGGAGSAVLEVLQQQQHCRSVLLGLPDRFLEHGEAGQLLAQCGLDANGIVAVIEKVLAGQYTHLFSGSQQL